jgi:hypothetical protein
MPVDPALDTILEEQRRRAAIAAEAERSFIADFAVLLDQADFRRWLWFLIDNESQCRAHGMPSVSQRDGTLILDPLLSYFLDGRRSVGVGLSITAQKISPKLYLRMLTEQMGLRSAQVSPPVQTGPK